MDYHSNFVAPAWCKKINAMQTVATGIDDDGVVKTVVAPQAVGPRAQRRVVVPYPFPDISLVPPLVERRTQSIVKHVPARASQHDSQEGKNAKDYPKYEISASTILHISNF